MGRQTLKRRTRSGAKHSFACLRLPGQHLRCRPYSQALFPHCTRIGPRRAFAPATAKAFPDNTA